MEARHSFAIKLCRKYEWNLNWWFHSHNKHQQALLLGVTKLKSGANNLKNTNIQPLHFFQNMIGFYPWSRYRITLNRRPCLNRHAPHYFVDLQVSFSSEIWPIPGDVDDFQMLRWQESACGGVIRGLWWCQQVWLPASCVSLSPTTCSPHRPDIVCILTFTFAQCASLQPYTVNQDKFHSAQKQCP